MKKQQQRALAGLIRAKACIDNRGSASDVWNILDEEIHFAKTGKRGTLEESRELDEAVARILYPDATDADLFHPANRRAYGTDAATLPEMLAWLRGITLPTEQFIVRDTKEAYVALVEDELNEPRFTSGYCATINEALCNLVLAVSKQATGAQSQGGES